MGENASVQDDFQIIRRYCSQVGEKQVRLCASLVRVPKPSPLRGEGAPVRTLGRMIAKHTRRVGASLCNSLPLIAKHTRRVGRVSAMACPSSVTASRRIGRATFPPMGEGSRRHSFEAKKAAISSWPEL